MHYEKFTKKKYSDTLSNIELHKVSKYYKQFFSKKGIQVEVIKLNGSMELAPSLNMCRRIVDLVSTEKLFKYGLIEVEEIMKVQSKLIITDHLIKLK